MEGGTDRSHEQQECNATQHADQNDWQEQYGGSLAPSALMDRLDGGHLQKQHIKAQKYEHRQGTEYHKWDGIQKSHQGRDQGEWDHNCSESIRQFIERSLTAEEPGRRLYNRYAD